jgi:hypothetical protein
MANTFDTGSTSTSYAGVYKQDWEAKLQERLNYPQSWKEICDVIMTNAQVQNVPYESTVPSVTTGTRGTAYTFSDFALTNQQLNITDAQFATRFVDRADMAQCGYVRQMAIAEEHGILLNEKIESKVMAALISATNVGITAGTIGLGTGAITVSATNIDDIIRGIKRLIIKYNGTALAQRNGIFFVWRPEDFELLEAFVQANGQGPADKALVNGIPMGIKYMGCDHYVSNSLTSTHIHAGVKKLMKLGILNETYGKMTVTEDPGLLSGFGFVSRIDIGTLIPTNYLPILFDINVTAIS